ncbi:MAG TPA: hypothetical protein VNG33_11420 [Polyangiaceae bacterium]|nr:hypothetical protein [Polyangiaceae bacterium]
MLRTTFGWSMTFVLVLGGVGGGVACSSKSTDEGTGGHGTTITGGSGNDTAGTGGTNGTTGGVANSGAGTTNTGKSGSATTGGSTVVGGACTDTAITCVDATMASGCNPDTGKVETFSCVDDAMALGIVSTGCVKDALNGDSCDFTDFADMACADGAQAFAYCENLTDEQLLNVYINCFQDNKGGHQIVTCFNKYVTPTMKTSADCGNAENFCAPGAGGAPPDTGAAGAGGAGGAGGAP